MQNEPRLIDANKLDLSKIYTYFGGVVLIEDVQKWIEEAPTIEAEPVRPGRWIPYCIQSGPLIGCTGYRCSCCGREEEDNGEPYCHCGAKMDAKEETPND